ncbi:hypothetical protein DSCO28_04160 [Desulfosarcina ovata subsp. sediminis]|uniref:Glycosyltransferase 2-like domain-containing protein n=1 Tax=Desulfosarcina ovata subsp. sediminis TaxID=885957 RepID=A0A5K7ZMW9_9BACT|nr:glycosyltransferase family A protein [Desulfosarcina ovata]BBO79850.1 hypothetical protein DSCO28_04160 [Desulfosarcina ovata subsp. sediminis]
MRNANQQKHEINEYPLVSAIIPAFNAQYYIETTVQSICGQSYSNIEIIVVDDGSTDETTSIIEQLSKKDKRIRLCRQANQGLASARNLGIRHSKGDFIAPVDADDVCYPTKIENLLGCMAKTDKQVGLAYSWSTRIDEKGNIIGKGRQSQEKGDVFGALLFTNFIGNGSACMIRKSCLDNVGLYDTAFFEHDAQGCEDWDLYMRIAEKFKFEVVNDYLTMYRKTATGMSNNYFNMEKSKRLALQKLKTRNPWIPDRVICLSNAYYLIWLSNIALQNECFFDSYKLYLKAGNFDPALFSDKTYLVFLMKRLLKSIRPVRALHSRYNRAVVQSNQCNHRPNTSNRYSLKKLDPNGRRANHHTSYFHLWGKRYEEVIKVVEKEREKHFASTEIIPPNTHL